MINKKMLVQVMVITYILGMLAYGYVFMNFVPAHDGIMTVCTDQYWQMGLGRCLMKYYVQIRGVVEAPWLIGMLTMFYVALSSYMVIDLLDVGDELWKIFIITSLFALNLTLTNSALTYIYLLDIYAMALLCATAAVYVLVKFDGIVSVLAAAALVSISMGLYQSYLAVAVGLLMIVGIKKLVDNAETKAIINYVIKLVIVLVLGSIGYIIMLRVLSHINNIPIDMGNVSGISNINISNLFQLIIGTYGRVYKFFFAEFIYSNNSFRYINILIMVCGIIAYGYIIVHVREVWRKLVIAAAIILFPIGTNFLYILTAGGHLHYLMMFSYQLQYVLLLYPFLCGFIKSKIKIQKYAVTMAIILLSVLVIRFANDIFYYQKMVGEGTKASMTSILYDLERNSDFDPSESTIVVVGEPRVGLAQNYMMRAAYQQYDGIDMGTTVTYKEVFEWYFIYVFGRNYIFDYSDETVEEYSKMKEVENMPFYPEAGYMKEVNGNIVIKFEDWE
ncbi:Glucosyl transferase GtrII [Butyrivibrio sp. Su6]|uniref:glucosyltransferase domain-containing protein n=1 Tax=Butyrivibrio sp. Su6 TaxID=1520810 RepID=UPI00089EEC40|nr:glucosyltransferase domain-containing protein [Butyrivibrio sp. Su6]SEG15857.1 Glucosyl transferase GtrII [Butyrivibrio sp. Su6]